MDALVAFILAIFFASVVAVLGFPAWGILLTGLAVFLAAYLAASYA
jgi:hypothetical protein